MTVLHEPLELGCGLVLPNRMMKSALSEGLGTAGQGPDERIERLYTRWGRGGYGLVITGNVMVDRRQLGEPGNIAITDDRDLDGLSRWAKATKDGGAPIWMQLNHPGRQANPLATRHQPVAPSAVAMNIPGLPAPRALAEAEIEEIIDRFAAAAKIAETAGFDGVQIHGAHGYLVSQFLSPLTNRRTDGWGGDPQRRMRFPLEVVRRIRSAVSPGFGVGIKLNSADFQRGGFTEEESRAVIEQIAAEHVDLIEISGGSYESPAMMGRAASTRAREAYFLEYAQSVRELASTVPLAVTGGFRSRTAMTEAVASGACAIVGVGRPAAVHPEAAAAILGGTNRLDTPSIRLGLPRRLTEAAGVKSLDGALDLQWHSDQLHRIGAGVDPDPARSPWLTALTMVKRNGIDSFRSRRSAGAEPSRDIRRKFVIERAVGRYVANPAVRALGRIGVTTSAAAELETTGRKSGLTRRVPVSAAFDATGAWLISQHGTRSGWALNVGDEPNIRIRQGNRWRTGTAVLRPDDDVAERARAFAPHPLLAGLSAATFRALQTDPISVRVTFTD
ncbi:nitroreductase family deazaflavin-dependent oxidoreductase [Nocardia cyriacigeorgica]|uniref:Nitroreductase family deazaflavin-dependent oxidoreductase n=1 Tax=Nocardia cyriacigeorgica TaxID=135487 RepID=A0A6P1D0D0_9NOCA|nr:nitroreductase/quinone reductase family protein [Nocardia cyriacigeorgica]NEW38955.1 nitroreductase family deazaflavin-dependent oxidoreductase [Nocardia cyriacigeorgica]NEW43757.1 nitroreductase family deazaflavin-dependent oxidoreductase [Nocardia cyriacigeorgica]NEW54942.1 nitroreductase family deazaflavin-dependent oxidoreductase [Nocardia cyriacigeorgica]